MEQVSSFYKGRVTLMELYEMPVSMFQVLYMIAFEKMNSEEGKKEAEADVVEEVMDEGGLIP